MKLRVRSAVAASAALVVVLGVAAPSGAYQRPGSTTLVSDGLRGAQADGNSASPVISANGRYMAFSSLASNLVKGDKNGAADVFVRDLRTGRTRLVSVGIGGTPALGPSSIPSISASGRYVAFTSNAKNLVPGTTTIRSAVFVRDMKKGVTSIASVSNVGVQPVLNASSSFQAISGDGRYVVFYAEGLLDTKGLALSGVYVRDMKRHSTMLASVSSAGDPANALSGFTGCGDGSRALTQAGISANGRYVVFTSKATNLVGSGSGLSPLAILKAGQPHIYVHSLRGKKTTVMVDVGTDGNPAFRAADTGGCMSYEPSIDPSGRIVAFSSVGTNLVPNLPPSAVPNGLFPLMFVRDLRTGRTERVDVDSSGENTKAPTQVAAMSDESSISASGRYVVFYSQIWQMIPGRKANGIYVHDLLTGATELVSVTGNNDSDITSLADPMTVDGRHVFFVGGDAGLVGHDTNGMVDVFERDRGPVLGTGTTHVTLAGAPRFGSTGLATVTDPAADLDQILTGQGGNLIGATLARRPQLGDLFVRLDLQDMPMFAAANPALVYGLDLRVHGVRYEVRAAKTGVDASFGLFRQDDLGLWTKVADLRGGYGTTGDEVVFSVPLQDLGLQNGGRLSHVDAFTALGSYDLGPVRILDREEIS